MRTPAESLAVVADALARLSVACLELSKLVEQDRSQKKEE